MWLLSSNLQESYQVFKPAPLCRLNRYLVKYRQPSRYPSPPPPGAPGGVQTRQIILKCDTIVKTAGRLTSSRRSAPYAKRSACPAGLLPFTGVGNAAGVCVEPPADDSHRRNVIEIVRTYGWIASIRQRRLQPGLSSHSYNKLNIM